MNYYLSLAKREISSIKNRYPNQNIFFIIYKIISLGSSAFKRRFSVFIRNLFGLRYMLNTDMIELEIMTGCNLRCANCNRSSTQAPSNEMMSEKQVKEFIEESKKLNKKWHEIRILGGEPTLHPNILKIFDLLLEYKSYSPDTYITLLTNGYGKKVNDVLEKVPKGIRVLNSSKTSPVQLFSAYNIAPIDLDEYKNKNIDFARGCTTTETCGLTLSRYGYYACGPGASADRVFGWSIAIDNLKDALVEENLRGQEKKMCQYCGHFKDYIREKAGSTSDYVDTQLNSKTWEEAYEKYKKEKPKLKLYKE